MTSPSVADRLTYLAELDIAPDPGESGRGWTPATPSDLRYVLASSIVSMNADIRATHRLDTLNSTLCAWLAATKKVDRFTQPHEWVTAYEAVLTQLGWVTSARSNVPFVPANDFSLVDLVTSCGTDVDVEAVVDLRELPHAESAPSLFCVQSVCESQVRFQVLSSLPEGDDVAAEVMFYAIDSTVDVVDVLRTDFDVSAHVSAHRLRQELNEEVYGPLRQRVIDKLGNLPQTYIHQFRSAIVRASQAPPPEPPASGSGHGKEVSS